MKRVLSVLLMAALLLSGSMLSAWAQEPAPIPVIPEEEITPTPKGLHHYMLICIDSWDTDLKKPGNHTDGMILVTVDEYARRVMLTSFIRDMLIQRPDGDFGRLIIGVSPFRSMYLMPLFVKQLKARFPGLQVVLSEANSAQLHKGITEGQYDFAIMNLPVDEAALDVIPLERDVLVLAVPDEMIIRITPVPSSPHVPLDLAACKALPFIVLSQQQELRQQFRKLCTSAGLEADIQVEVVGIATAWAMVKAGVGATVLPRQFVQHEQVQGVTFFPILQQAVTRQPAIITRRDQYISQYAEYAIHLLQTI